MNLENYEVLQTMLRELKQEYEQAQKKINFNSSLIKESRAYLESLLEGEDSDFRMFSPRNLEVVHKDEISKINSKLTACEEENEKLIPVSEKLSSRIDTLEKLLKDEENHNVKFLHIQEDERYRISRDLHDTSLQNLAHLVHKIELSSMFIDQDPLRAKLELSLVNKNLKAIIEEIRNTIFNLRPMEFDDLGLKAAFERLISLVNGSKQYEIDFDVEDVSCENNIILLTLYRAVQECLTNIVKHADATKIIFHAKQSNGKYHILIEDNGKGFKQEEVEQKRTSHFGLSLMKERISILKGTISISSGVNGTKVEIEIPIEEDLVIR